MRRVVSNIWDRPQARSDPSGWESQNLGRCKRWPVSSRQDTMTVITSDVLKARPEGPKIVRKARKKNKGKTEKVVPPIWESTKVVDRLKYQVADEQETLGVQDWPPGWEPRYKVSETVTPEVWTLEEEVEELVYGHATLEEVAFEWGKFNRPVR